VIISFAHVGNGLITSTGGAPSTFQIKGTSGKYVTATATVVGNTIEITSSVAAPKSVRYGFGSIGNLFNAVSIPVAGGAATVTRLPASMFQIDFP
jgi:hypothetical protein